MDSITHLFAGAAVAALAAPGSRRRAALGIGALVGSLPDVDNLWLAFADPVSRFVEHRGVTHSLLLLPLYAVACWALLRLWRPSREAPWRWLAAVTLALASHLLLDALTVYGTRLFWPIDPAPVMGSNLFIVDPSFTLPLLLGCVVAWFARRDAKAKAWLGITAALAGAYVGWTFVAKQQLDTAVRRHFAAQATGPLDVLTTPTPFNTLIWRVLVPTDEGGYFEGYYSFLRGGPMKLDHYPGGRTVPADDGALPALERLREFTRGYYRIDQRDGEYVFVDLRMGGEPDYLFQFAIAKRDGDAAVALDPPRQVMPAPGFVAKAWRRFKPMLLEGKPTPAAG